MLEALKKSDYFSSLKTYQARAATDEEILACHSGKYLARVRREIESGAERLSTGDTWVCRKSLTAADYACGAACVAVDAVLERQGRQRLLPDAAAGTPRHGQSRHGLLRFQQRGHCRPLCPAQAPRGQGADRRLGRASRQRHARDLLRRRLRSSTSARTSRRGIPGPARRTRRATAKGLGTTLNCPLKRGAGRKEFMAAFHDKLAPAVSRFKPELIILSAGFDARHGDPLGRLELTDKDYRDLTGLVLEMAKPNAKGRVVSILEGGYNLTGLAAPPPRTSDDWRQG